MWFFVVVFIPFFPFSKLHFILRMNEWILTYDFLEAEKLRQKKVSEFKEQIAEFLDEGSTLK